MAYSYIGYDRDQLFLLPPSMWDWLPEGHLALFVIDVVGLIDTAAFHEARPTDGAGRRAYDPDMMLTLLLYSYAIGVRSSRAIERACHSDLAFRVICANLVPDHGTIARFRAENEEAVKGVFVEVVKLCRAAGLTSLGRIAVDGTKIGSDASLEANHSAETIRAEIEQILSEAAETDRSEDKAPPLLGDLLVPEEMRTHRSRLDRLKAALADVEAQAQAASSKQVKKAERARIERDAGKKVRGRKPKDPVAARARAEADLVVARLRAERQPGRSDFARGLEAAERRLLEVSKIAAPTSPRRGPVANVTDPESRIMKTKDGWLQGYNVQAAVNEHQIVIAYAATQDHNDVGQLAHMIAAIEKIAATAGIKEDVGLLLADAGYWSDENATSKGPDRLIATTKDWKQRKAARLLGHTSGPPPEGATPLEAMEHRLRTEEGAAAYASRSYTVEPVFGDTKENRGVRRFMRRGLVAADSEAGLVFAAHNLLKIFRTDPSAIHLRPS